MSVQYSSMINSVGVLSFDKPTHPPVTTQTNSSANLPAPGLSPSIAVTQSTSHVTPSYQALSEATAKLNLVAETVRQADTTMENIGNTVEKMKSTLEGIVKNFPPFPPGSEKRVALLKTFISLRNEIERMAFPPEPSLVPKLIADPSRTNGSFAVSVDGQGTSIQLDRQRVDPGQGGLNIPVLPVYPPEDSGDKAIHAAMATLTTASSTITDRRQSLAENFTRQALPAVAVTVARQSTISASAQERSAFSEQAAVSNSLTIQRVFLALPVGISSGGDTFMRELL